MIMYIFFLPPWRHQGGVVPELPAVSSHSGPWAHSKPRPSIPPIPALGLVFFPRLCLDQDALPSPAQFIGLGSPSFRPLSISITFSYFIRLQKSHGCRVWNGSGNHIKSVVNGNHKKDLSSWVFKMCHPVIISVTVKMKKIISMLNYY